MSRTKNGGFAFPQDDPIKNGLHEGYGTDRGMTLRDYFAAKAMVATYLNGFAGPDRHERARICYEMADAMLAERAK